VAWKERGGPGLPGIEILVGLVRTEFVDRGESADDELLRRVVFECIGREQRKNMWLKVKSSWQARRP